MTSKLDEHVKAYQGQNLYDFDNYIQLNWYPYRILDLAASATSILELGVGHGITTNIFSKYFYRHVVLDASPAVINNFKKNFPDCSAQIIETFFEKFESDEKFDIIVLGFVLEHVDNPVEIMAYFKNFLSPEGKMFVTVPNAEVLNRRLGYIAGILPDMKQLSEHDLMCGHKRYYTVQSLAEEAKNAGYKIERLEGIYLKPFTTTQIMSLNFDQSIINALCEVGLSYPELSCGILAQLKEL
jgi:2-polyprenyl-3-methyl-5-hydroxy-6-metoxy-1,4-benzoquinol methylase